MAAISGQSRIIVGALFASLLISGCQKPSGLSTGSASATSTGGASSWKTAPATPPRDVRGSPSDVVIEASALFNEYKTDPSVLQKYSGKVLEITGKIRHVNSEPYYDGSYYNVTFQVPGGEPGEMVICHMQEKSEWSKLGIDQEVTLKGEGEAPVGMFRGPVVKNCIVIKAGPATQLRFGAKELAREYAANRAETLKKCAGRTVVVTGEMLRTDQVGNFPCIDLRGTNEVDVRFQFFLKQELATFTGKAGDTLTILGRGESESQQDGRIRFHLSHLVK